MTELVHRVVEDGVATITLDSPHNRNALSAQLTTELLTVLREAEKDDAVKIVLLAAEGPVFCSGADLSEASTGDFAEGPRTIVKLQRTLVALSKPVVVRVQGPVRAGGFALVAGADIAIARRDVSFALTEVRLGLAAAAISVTVLRRLNDRAAAYAVLTGDSFDADKAAEIGLITTAVDDLDAEVDRVVGLLKKGTPQGLRESKRLLVRDLVAHIDERGEEMAQLSARLFGSEEAREAMLAFLSRKK
jgi:enoyl-CoA hydratase/carnithine racemase